MVYSREYEIYSLTSPRQKGNKTKLPHGIDWTSTVDHPTILDNFLTSSGFKTDCSEDATSESHLETHQPASPSFQVKSVSEETMAITTPLSNSRFAPGNGAVGQGEFISMSPELS